MLIPPFRCALTRQPAATVAAGLTTQADGSPDLALTLLQHQAYLQALYDCGLEVTVLPANERFPDGHYVEDTAVIFRDMAFICRPGAETRMGETVEIARQLQHLRQVHVQGEEARIDGGDVLFCHDRVLIGFSARTNLAGAEQLRVALREVQADIRVDFVSFEGVLHLKSGLNELAPGVLVHDPHLHTDYGLDFAEVIELPPDEGYAANLLPINDTLLIAQGYPVALKIAEKYYTHIIALDMSEFRKMDGGLSCLSLRY